MTRRDLARMRAAALVAVNALFDSLEATQPANTTTRPAAEVDDAPVSELSSARATAILRKHGVG